MQSIAKAWLWRSNRCRIGQQRRQTDFPREVAPRSAPKGASRRFSTTPELIGSFDDPLNETKIIEESQRNQTTSSGPESLKKRPNLPKTKLVVGATAGGVDKSAELLAHLSTRLNQATETAFEQAHHIWDEYVFQHGVIPSMAHYEAILRVYLGEGDLSSARALIQDIRGQQRKMSNRMYNLSLQVRRRGSSAAPSNFQCLLLFWAGFGQICSSGFSEAPVGGSFVLL